MIQTKHPMRVWRNEKRITLNALAEKVGVTPSHLSEIERGVNSPSLDLAAKLSRATADETGHPAVDVLEFAKPQVSQ